MDVVSAVVLSFDEPVIQMNVNTARKSSTEVLVLASKSLSKCKPWYKPDSPFLPVSGNFPLNKELCHPQ